MNAAATRATFSDFRLIKTRKVAQLVFEVPIEEADGALHALGGLPRSDDERWCGIARLQEKAPVAPSPRDPARSAQAKEAYRGKDEGERAVVRAGLLCKDPEFQKWCGSVDEEESAKWLRYVLTVRSRQEIANSDKALKNFLDIEFRFKQSVGRAPVDMSA